MVDIEPGVLKNRLFLLYGEELWAKIDKYLDDFVTHCYYMYEEEIEYVETILLV